MATLTRGRTSVAVRVLFYGGLALLLLGALVPFWPDLLPGPIASRVGHNSEAYLLILVLAAWIESVGPAVRTSRAEVLLTALVAVGALGVALLLLRSDLPSRIVTLNETCVALAFLVPYVQLRRPLPAAGVWTAVALVGLVILLGGERTAVVTAQAEAIGALLLVPITLDLVDRGILDPGGRTSRALRYGWYVLLLTLPVVLSVLQYRVGINGPGEDLVRFGVRTTEAFIACVLLSAYFAVVLRRTGREAGPAGLHGHG